MLKGNWNLCLGEYKQDFLTKGWRRTLEIGLGYRCFYIKHIFSFHLYYASDRYYYQIIVLMRMANIKLKLNCCRSCGYKVCNKISVNTFDFRPRFVTSNCKKYEDFFLY